MIPQKKEYATVRGSDGVNYREIAEIMTALGYDMNHSSARNHLLRIMRRFYVAYCRAQGFDVPDDAIDEACRSAGFQEAVSQFIQQIECRRRTVRQVVNVEPTRTIESAAVMRKVYGSGQNMCVRHMSRIYVPCGVTNVLPGGSVVLLPFVDDESKVEVHVRGEATSEEWIRRVE
jgi:hypothetical protein